MKDMYSNGLDLSIQDKCMIYKERQHPLFMENYCLVHRWEPDRNLCMYTEDEIRKLHKSFGHPTVNALSKTLKNARPNDMSPEYKNGSKILPNPAKLARNTLQNLIDSKLLLDPMIYVSTIL